jgi:hypothetical protein
MSSVDLDKLQDKTLDIIFYITTILYIAIAFGVYFVPEIYITYIHDFIKLYVCLFLIYRFNPFNNTKCSNLDKRIAFTAGFFLLSTTIIDRIFSNIINKTKTNIEKIRKETDTYIQKYD